MKTQLKSALNKVAVAKSSDTIFQPSFSNVFSRMRRAKHAPRPKKIKFEEKRLPLPKPEPAKLPVKDEVKKDGGFFTKSELKDLLVNQFKNSKTEPEKKVEEDSNAKSISLKHLTNEESVQKKVSQSEKVNETQIKDVDESFPLITLDVEGKKKTFVNGKIKWYDEDHALKYEVNEPKLNEQESKILEEIKLILERKLDVQFKAVNVDSAFKFLRENVNNIIKKIGLTLSDEQRMKFDYFIYRDFIGLSVIEPLMHDTNIEDISCDGPNIPIFIYHRNPQYAGMETNLMFKSAEELDSFVLKISQKTGKTISVAEPLLDGALPDGSRVQATFGSDIARRGSNFTIRKFMKEPITPIHEINFATANAELLAYLWLAIENGLSILISGATATGKTSFLNAISLFIKRESKIVSIEDTPELRLPHPNWVPEVARKGFGRDAYGEVSMFDLLKASLRQRPDYIIVGEVRGKEANVMFQSMATGHAGLGTLHADSFSAVYDRLTTKPIELPASMIENLDIIVFLVVTKRDNKYLRKVKEIVEIIEYDIDSNQLVTNKVFDWNPNNNSFRSFESKLLDRMREKMGISEEQILEEITHRSEVLKWLFSKKIMEYDKMADYIKRYYHKKNDLMKEVRGG
ncbi:MAG: type II/IV secretion system ATPase subunit [Nanoarchaeota archaeon]|nr:type II/IV secretion system ATPase subunit [Nanoarchaeota archaeon]